jgi:hypothetical protein
LLSRLGGFEIISPVLSYNDPSKWQVQLRTVFETIDAEFSISVDAKCGTHVHFSPTGGWKLGNLRDLAVAVIMFESQVDKLLPLRVGNIFCRSNSESAILDGLTVAEKVSQIRTSQSLQEIVLAMCSVLEPDDDESPAAAVNLYLYNAVGVAFSGGVLRWLNPKFPTVGFWSAATASLYHFRAEPWRSFSDDTAEQLPSPTILERSRGGAPATILRSDCPAL